MTETSLSVHGLARHYLMVAWPCVFVLLSSLFVCFLFAVGFSVLAYRLDLVQHMGASLAPVMCCCPTPLCLSKACVCVFCIGQVFRAIPLLLLPLLL
jgi:hypothetical protein